MQVSTTRKGMPRPEKISSSIEPQLLVDAVGVLGQAVDEHLDLGELVDAVQALGELAGGARLAAEAVREAGEAQGEVGFGR